MFPDGGAKHRVAKDSNSPIVSPPMLLQKQRTSRGLSSIKGRRKSKVGTGSSAVKNYDEQPQDNLLDPSKIHTPKGSRSMSANALFVENANSDKPIEFSKTMKANPDFGLSMRI